VGALAVVAVPAAIVVAELSDPLELLHAAVAIPVAAVAGAAAIVLARRARAQVQLTLGRIGGQRLAGLGRALGLAGLWIAVTATLAVAVYGVLSYVAS
jgi:hypothetical protein